MTPTLPTMHVLILHQATNEESAVDEQDVLRQRDAVEAALKRLGHRTSIVACTLGLDRLWTALRANRPDVVFNLVESLAGSDRLIAVVPAILASLDLPYTGVKSDSLVLTTSKVLAKRQMVSFGLPTLPWAEQGHHIAVDGFATTWPSRWIRKPIYEHASLGMTDEAVVVCNTADDLFAAVAEWELRLGRPCLAEPFVEGREFNVSLLARASGPQVLPLAEIDFRRFPVGKPRIVGFAAKWDDSSPESLGTPRRFNFAAADVPLLQRLEELALRCWDAFHLSGYARIDFRVDEQGQPWILEINANPCLSPDAGFAAAVAQAGLSFDEAIERILSDAVQSGGGTR